MLRYETLLLRQLQKQQNRDEFCDTVLHTQGVSVPVHSCVLSAFSPRLYGTLSSMPVPMAGQRKLIRLQAVDACTLLSLVSLLYSGQLYENKEQVLSAAQTLGIELPQWQEEERHGGKVRRRKETEDAQLEMVKESDSWMTRRMEVGSSGEKEKTRASGTQTECERETDERGAQTDLQWSELQSIPTLCLIDQPTCLTNQQLDGYMEILDTTSALQIIHPERISTTCDVLAMAPDTGNCHTVSESSSVSQMFLYSLKTSNHKPSTSVTLSNHDGFTNQSKVVPAAGPDAINDLKKFEGNIPGFINYFLDSNNSETVGRSEQGCVRDRTKVEHVVKRARARSTDAGSLPQYVKCVGGTRRQKCKGRWGLVASLAWRGQGGGRVGRLLETRSTWKNQMRAFQRRQGSEALVEAREARARGKHRQRGKRGTITGREGQNDRPRRPRGRPRVRPLPPASRSFSTITPFKQSTVDTTELDLLHTVTSMPDPQTEPIDALLDDIMTGLHFLPPEESQTNRHDFTLTGPPISKSMYPNSHSVKPTEPKQHQEGELNDILDHFLRTFDQYTGSYALDVGEEPLQDKFDSGHNKPDHSTDTGSNTSKTHVQLQPYNPYLHHQKQQADISTPCTQQQFSSTDNLSVPKLSYVNAQDVQTPASEVKKPSVDENSVQHFEYRRMTRSQSMKRKLETAFSNLQNPVNCKEKQSTDTHNKRQRDSRERVQAYVNQNVVNNMDKSRVLVKGKQKQARVRGRRHERKRFGKKKRSVKNRSHPMDDLYERKKNPREGSPERNKCCKMKKNVNDHAEAERTSKGFQAGRSCVKSQTGGSCIEIASSTVEKVRMLLQLQGEEENERANKSGGKHWENRLRNGRPVNHNISVADERLPVGNGLPGKVQEPKDTGKIIGKGQLVVRKRSSRIAAMNQRLEDKERMADGLRHEDLTTEERSTPLRPNQTSNAAKEKNNNSEPASSTESEANGQDSLPFDTVSALGDVPPFTPTSIHKTAVEAAQLTSAAQLLHTQPCPELVSPHVCADAWAKSSVDEDGDVDVLEVSSPTSGPPAVSTVISVDLISEEEVEVEDEVEIDVLGLDTN